MNDARRAARAPGSTEISPANSSNGTATSSGVHQMPATDSAARASITACHAGRAVRAERRSAGGPYSAWNGSVPQVP